MVDPLDTHASDNVAFTTGARVHPHLALDSHLEGAIHANYKEIVTKVIQRNPDTAAGQPIAELETEKRDVFGAGLGTTRLATKPMGRTGPEALADPQFKALLELLIRKGVLSRQEYEQELRGAPESSAERDGEPE